MNAFKQNSGSQQLLQFTQKVTGLEVSTQMHDDRYVNWSLKLKWLNSSSKSPISDYFMKIHHQAVLKLFHAYRWKHHIQLIGIVQGCKCS
jgi:hypothetical protein